MALQGKACAYGSVDKYKSRFVSCGFYKKEGIDHEENFSPVAKYNTIRSIISLPSILGWKHHQMDVKTVILNGEIEKVVYIEQPERFVIHGKESHVCKSNKALYELKQAPRAWYARIVNYTHKLGFMKSDANSNLYFKVVENQPLILVLYVDDIFLTREEILIAECQRDLT